MVANLPLIHWRRERFLKHSGSIGIPHVVPLRVAKNFVAAIGRDPKTRSSMPLLQDVSVRSIIQPIHGLVQRLVLHGPERVPHIVLRIDRRHPAPRHPPGKRRGSSNRPRSRTSW
eukprot:7184752-Pyramimonas_sp.AAC.1